jgi:hypothetical protein
MRKNRLIDQAVFPMILRFYFQAFEPISVAGTAKQLVLFLCPLKERDEMCRFGFVLTIVAGVAHQMFLPM